MTSRFVPFERAGTDIVITESTSPTRNTIIGVANHRLLGLKDFPVGRYDFTCNNLLPIIFSHTGTSFI